MEQNIEQNIASVPQTFTESPQHFTAMPELEEIIKKEARRYALKELGLTEEQAEHPKNKPIIDTTIRDYKAGVIFALQLSQCLISERDKKIGWLQGENEHIKSHYFYAEYLDSLTKQRDELIVERDEIIDHLAFFIYLLKDNDPDFYTLKIDRKATALLKRYYK